MDQSNFEAGLAPLRELKRRLILLYALFFPLEAIAFVAVPFGDWVVGLVAISVFIVWSIAFYRYNSALVRSDCPRCEYRFFGRGARINNYRTQCASCGLSLYPPK